MATIGDLVLVYVDMKPGFYARIEDINPDIKRDWWQVTLLVLAMPLQVYTWILDSSQVDGSPFTMGGTPIRLEKIVSPVSIASTERPAPPMQFSPTSDSSSDETSEERQSASRGQLNNVVSLSDRRKNR